MDYLDQLISNKAIWTAVAAWAIAQIIKIIVDIVTLKRFDPKLLVASGGMPSSHSSFVVSMATTMGFMYGFDSGYFTIAFVLAFIVMYDAAGVRRAAGQQAAVLNRIIASLDNFKIDKKFKELLGHTPIQVIAGAALGIVVSCVVHLSE
jgi:acid phosphatase family membrane protein YuiD